MANVLEAMSHLLSFSELHFHTRRSEPLAFPITRQKNVPPLEFNSLQELKTLNKAKIQ